MSYTEALQKRFFGQTMRSDIWWLQPAAVFFGLLVFIAYAVWAAFQGDNYHVGPYLSPFYSPEVFGESSHSWFGPKPSWWPTWLPFSPSFLIIWAPAGFRLTCYYFRGAYYKGIWADPPACTVGEPRKVYRGENCFPLILQNIHRYFLYIALVLIILHLKDIWNAVWFEDSVTGAKSFGIGVGTLVLAADVILLSFFVFGCHAFRHLIGGRLDCFSCSTIQYRAYCAASVFNRRHMFWAWTSLYWVGFADLYVRLCAMGVWTDWRII
jgi:hypothetical protein